MLPQSIRPKEFGILEPLVLLNPTLFVEHCEPAAHDPNLWPRTHCTQLLTVTAITATVSAFTNTAVRCIYMFCESPYCGPKRVSEWVAFHLASIGAVLSAVSPCIIQHDNTIRDPSPIHVPHWMGGAESPLALCRLTHLMLGQVEESLHKEA